MSTDKEKVYQLSLEEQKVENPKDAVKDPYVLEFFGLQELLREHLSDEDERKDVSEI